MIRSVLAVIAGIAALTVTSFAIEALADPLLMGMFPQALPTRAAIGQNLPASLFLYVYTALCVAFGGYVTAWVARRAPVGHALIMGVVQTGLTLAGDVFPERTSPAAKLDCRAGHDDSVRMGRGCMAMATELSRIQPLLAFAAGHLDEDLSLTALAGKSGLSPFHLHRVFCAAAGETPKQFTLRLRLDRAAVLLLTTNDSVLDVAIACGFASHEVFCRAFRGRFGMRPRAYRTRGFEGDPPTHQKQEHAAAVARTGPCLRFFHSTTHKETMPYSITRKEIAPRPVLVSSSGG